MAPTSRALLCRSHRRDRQATDLSGQNRRHWACSLRQIAKWLDRPAATVPARWTSVRLPVGQLHHARVGVTAKTLTNHRSNARAALRWFARSTTFRGTGCTLSADWAAFRDRIDDRLTAARLYSLMRYCSARGIAPSLVNDKVVDDYWRYRAETTALVSNNSARRRMARMWNSCARSVDGWPLQRLTEPPIKAKAAPAWEDFPAGCAGAWMHIWLGSLNAAAVSAANVSDLVGRRRFAPAAPKSRRWRAWRFGSGCRSRHLTSLAALLHPDVVEQVIEAYWQKDGDEPKVYTIDLGWRLLTIAREIGGLDEASLDRLDEIRATLEDHRRSGLTPKNLQLVRQVLTEGVWSEVVSLPNVLMQQARSAKDHAPIKAAVTAQTAVAIAILTFAPVRVSNLISIQLDNNLIRPGGLNTAYWLVFPHYDVKNRVDLQFNLMIL